MYSNQTPTPTAFKCAIDGQWLTPDHYSQRQIAKWHQQKKKLRDGVTPNTIGLICKEHTGQTQSQTEHREIHCNGPCGAWKPREQFSKNQRNIDNPRCITCTFWATNVGAKEAPPAIHENEMHSQAMCDGFLPAQDGFTDDRASHAETNVTMTGTTAVQSSGVTSEKQQDIDGDHGSSMSIIRGIHTSKTHGTAFGDQDPRKGTSIKNFTGYGHLRGELVIKREPDSGITSSLPGLQGITPSVEEEKSHLYNQDPFSPIGHSAENLTTAAPRMPFKASNVADRPDKVSNGKWAKPDTRKVFYANAVYEPPKEGMDTHDPDWESDDEIDF
ncbi:uncharacterized protein GGS22DRAFT_191115 [Annulohypoxylon maeteangense]|uniref:uncharacterized protein n=1 Tax=Annulohypoxylon maeteangense TaxID=1927788 RepID=UPI0020086350|nr:uncharacterized protein GGS22DRAFT_191115 [Annulohypoxylon maeteangense]KAI0882525.1 hypothetical protein GGS22DRAFT_191115 [Annulohypoxylon maeteangense]